MILSSLNLKLQILNFDRQMSATKLATIRSWTETYAKACQIPALAHARICKQSNDGQIQQVNYLFSLHSISYAYLGAKYLEQKSAAIWKTDEKTVH